MRIDQKAYLAVLAGNVIFGFSFLFSKIALELTIPSVLIAIRFLTAFVVLNIVVLIGKSIRKADGTPLISFSLKGKPVKHILLMSIFQPVIYFIAENYGIVYTSSAFAGTIISVIPIAGIVVEIIILKEKVQSKKIFCAVASVIGVIITTIGATGMRSSVGGVIILLIAVIADAFFYLFSKKSGDYYSPLERTYVMFGIGSVVFVVMALIQSAGRFSTIVVPAVTAPAFWISVLYLAVASSVVAFLFINFGSSYVPVSKATLNANITTVISIVAGVIFLGEAFTVPQIIGAAIILLSVTFGNLMGQRSEKVGID